MDKGFAKTLGRSSLFMIVVFLRKRTTKHSAAPASLARSFQGDVWQEAQAVLDVEERWGLFADASAIAQVECARMRIADCLANTQTSVVIHCIGGEVVSGLVDQVGNDYVSIRDNGICVAVRLQSIIDIEGIAVALRVEGTPESVQVSTNLKNWLRVHDAGVIQCFMNDGRCIRGKLRLVGEDFLRIHSSDQRDISLVLQRICVIRTSKMSV